MRIARFWVWAALASSLALVAGCSDDDNGGSGITDIGGGNADPRRLTDSQIAHVLAVANEGEVMLSQLGQQQATSSAVRDFSTRMVNEHTAARQRLDPLAQNQGLQLEESIVSQQMQEELQRIMETLRGLEGARFDLALMDAQVAAHARTAMVGDALLTPQVQNQALAGELQTQRRATQVHLQDAAAIQADLFDAQ